MTRYDPEFASTVEEIISGRIQKIDYKVNDSDPNAIASALSARSVSKPKVEDNTAYLNSLSRE